MMRRWLMKFEVEADCGVDGTCQGLTFRHPGGGYEICVENQDMQPGCDSPLLNVYVVFQAIDIEGASKKGERHLARFLEFLSFTLMARFRIKRRLCLFDWERGVTERRGYVYRSFPDPNFPWLGLDHTLVSNIEQLLGTDADQDLFQALHWFAVAVSTNSRTVQFQLFWFSIETLARRDAEKTKVPDRCPQCRQPLYCPQCKRIPEHRPYPGQMIAQLFDRHVSDDPDRAYRSASAMRHALLHGHQVSQVEQEYGQTLLELVDAVGKVAWAALLTALLRARSDPSKLLRVMQPETFLRRRLAVKMDVTFPTPGDRDPQFSDIPKLDVELILQRAEQPGADESRNIAPSG